MIDLELDLAPFRRDDNSCAVVQCCRMSTVLPGVDSVAFCCVCCERAFGFWFSVWFPFVFFLLFFFFAFCLYFALMFFVFCWVLYLFFCFSFFLIAIWFGGCIIKSTIRLTLLAHKVFSEKSKRRQQLNALTWQIIKRKEIHCKTCLEIYWKHTKDKMREALVCSRQYSTARYPLHWNL